MTRKRTAILAGILCAALSLAVLVVLQSDPRSVSAQSVDSAPQIDLTQMEKIFAERESVYREQIVELDTLLQERRAIYEQQIETLTQALTVGRSHLENLAAQELSAEEQLTQFTQAQGERQTIYSTRRQEAQERYDIRYNQMLAQLAEVQAKLAEAQQMLGQ